MNYLESQSLKIFKPGDKIFKEKDPGSSMFIIQSGEVEISTTINKQKVVLAKLKDGSVFGEMSLVDGSPRSATVTTLKETTCLEISRMLFNKRLESIPGWMRSIYQILIDRLRDANKQHKSLDSKDTAKQIVFLIFSFIENKKTNLSEMIKISWQDTATNISFLLNLPENQVNMVMNKLSLTPFAKSEMNFNDGRQFCITDIKKFIEFKDFCKQRFLVNLGHEISREYEKQSPEEIQLLKLINTVLNEQGVASDFPVQFLEERCKKDLGIQLSDYKHQINELTRVGIIKNRVDSDSHKYYDINREQFKKRISTLDTLELFEKIEGKLG